MKELSRFVVVLVILATTFGIASATYAPPLTDLYVDEIDMTVHQTDSQLLVQAQTAPCIDKQYTYFQFDGSNISTATSASLVLTLGNVLGGVEDSPVLSLYGVPYSDPGTITASNNPEPTGTPLASIPIPPSTQPLSQITFAGTQLAEFIEQQSNTGNQSVSLALAFSELCSATGVTQVNFVSSDFTGEVTYRPAMAIEGTKKVPLAVSLAGSSAQRTSWPLYAGLGAVALLVVAGVVISRRRTT